jgi:hypothetical protein
MLWRFEHVVQYVQDMLAQGLTGVVALETGIRAAANRQVRDDDRVDVTGGASDLDLMNRAVFIVGVTVFLHALGARQDKHALGTGTSKEGLV